MSSKSALSPAGPHLGAAVPRHLGDGQSERLINALIEAVAERGYDATTVAEIVSRADVSKSTFYQHFSGKEECFVAAFEGITAKLAQVVDGAVSDADNWPAAVESGLAAILGFFAARPDCARLVLIESLSVSGGVRCYEAWIVDLLPFLDAERVNRPPETLLDPPEHLKETVTGGILWILFQQVRRGEAEKMEDLRPELVEFVIFPYLQARQPVDVAEGSSMSSFSGVPLPTFIRNADQIRARSKPVADSPSATELIREDRER